MKEKLFFYYFSCKNTVFPSVSFAITILFFSYPLNTTGNNRKPPFLSYTNQFQILCLFEQYT